MDRGGQSKPTLATIAERTGVSLSTVSKVLNGRTDVAPATRARVEAAIREVGYVAPVEHGSNVWRSIEVALGHGFTPYSAAVLEGVTDAADAEQVDVVVRNRRPHGKQKRAVTDDRWLHDVLARRRSGVIAITPDLSTADVAAFRRLGIPIVLIDPVNISRGDVASIGSTNWAGGLAATEYLLAQGHRRIAFAGALKRSLCVQARLHGYRAALETADLEDDAALIVSGRLTYDDGLRMGGHLLDLPEPPTAIFAASDDAALGVMEAARLRRLRLPDDLSVIGFDDSWYATAATPRLTTVRQPLREMGRAALRTLLTLSTDGTLESRHVELATELVVRDSVAPPAL